MTCNTKKNDSSFISYQQERFETEMFNNIEIFEDRIKSILSEIEEILLSENDNSKLLVFRGYKIIFNLLSIKTFLIS